MIEITTATATVPEIVIDGRPLSIDQVHDVAIGHRQPQLTRNSEVLRGLQDARALVDRAVDEGWCVYGITTGFGGMSDVAISGELAVASQNNLLSFLATGAGRPVDRRHVRAAMLLRANVLLQGRSGVRLEIVRRLVRFLKSGMTPVVSELGSIGASGDLVPLAAIARAITGQTPNSRVNRGKREIDSRTALGELDLEPLELLPKEGLAIVNGTSFSSAIAANCSFEARRLLALTLASQAMMLRALRVQDDPFHSFVHQCKPHPGQIWTARLMSRLLNQGVAAADNGNGDTDHVQDRYSLRCLPQYMGPVVEGLARIERVVQIEMNSVSDNPLVDVAGERFWQGGNFLGQYIGIAMDDLRRFLGLMARHLDIQIAQLVAPEFNRGLPASLRGNADRVYNMGLKGLQITGNSIMPQLTYLGNPLVEHFPGHAEQFNQNINGLSWGSANLAWQSIELYQHYSAVALIFAVQSLDLRARVLWGHCDGRALTGELLEPLYSAVYQIVDGQPGPRKPLVFDDSDQSLDDWLARLADNIRHGGSLVAALEPLIESFEQEASGI